MHRLSRPVVPQPRPRVFCGRPECVAWLLALGLLVAACSPGQSVTPADAGTDADEDGGADTDAGPEVVQIPVITTKLVIEPGSGNAPLPVTLRADIEGVDKSEVFVSWDFGDGDIQTFDLSVPAEADKDQVQHTYQFKGTYSVKVVVQWRKNPKKARAEATGSVVVMDPASLAVGEIQLQSPETVAAGDDVTLTFAVENSGDEVATPFEIGVWLSLDSTLDTADVQVHTEPVPGMAAGGKLQFTWDPETKTGKPLIFQVPGGLADGTYVIIVRVDPKAVVNEINRADNDGLCNDVLTLDTKVTAKSDLTVTAPLFESALSYSQGDSLKYEHTVGNAGEGEAKSVKFGVFLSEDKKLDYAFADGCKDLPGQKDKMLTNLSTSTLQKIAPKSTLPLFYSVVVPDVPDGNYYLIAAVDLCNVAAETDEANNLVVSDKTLTVKKFVKQGVDLALVDMVVKPKGTYLGASVSVEWQVKNTGTLGSPANFPATVFFCPTKAFSKGSCTQNQTSFTLPALAPGEEKTGATKVTISTQTPVQDWFVYLQLDPDNKTAELDEGNNVKSFDNLKITAQADVDIWPGNIGFHPASIVAGGDLKISYAVHNDGNTGSGASSTWYVLTPNGTCSAASAQTGGNVLLEKVVYGGLEGLETESISDVVSIPVGLDHKVSQYQLCVILDAEGNIAKDKNKGNNMALSAGKLTVLNPKGGCFEDAHDTAPADNDTQGTAAPVPADQDQTLGSCGDEDWWKIAVPKGHSLFVTLQASEPLWTTPVSPDLDLDLYGPDGKAVLDSNKLISANKKVAALAVATGGDHFVRVYPHVASARAHYKLNVQVVPPVQGIDLLGTGLVASPAATFPGGLVKTKLKLTNLGDKPAGAFVLRYVLSSDLVFDDQDAVLKNTTFEQGVQAAQTLEVAQNLLLPVVTGGKYWIGAILDPTGAVTEADEKNNVVASNPLQLNTQVSCAADAFSGNHTADDAASLQTTTASYAKLNVCPGLEDWFAIEVPEGKAFKVKLNWKYQAGKGLVGVQIVDASKTGVVAGSANAQKTEAVIPYVQTGGTYYIHTYVLPEVGSAVPYDYDLEVTLAEPDPTDVCLADYYEANNSPQSSPEIGCGTAALSLCLGDEDWFHLEMVKDEKLAFELTHPSGAFQLKVFGNPNLAPLKTLGTSGKLEFTAPADGTYYMQVSYKSPGSKPSTFAYGLKVDGGKGVDLIAKFQSVFPAQIVQGEDVYMTVKLSNECKDPAVGFYYGYYFSTDNKLDANDLLMSSKPVAGLDGKTDLSVDDKAIVPIDAKPGPAYVLVAADVSNTVAESQELNNSDAAPIEVVKLCIADLLEPNGAPQVAAPLPLGKTPDLSLCPYDLDWYSINLVKGETLTVTAEFEQAAGDLDLRLYKVNKFGAPVATAATKKAPEQFVYKADETTKYYLRINGFAGEANAYSLSACKKMGGSCVECMDDSVCGLLQECDLETTKCGPKKCTADDAGVCDDGNQCTVDTCTEAKTCSNAVAGAQQCSDADACTLGEVCDLTGTCVVPVEPTVLVMASGVTQTADLGSDVTLTADGGYVLVGARDAGQGLLGQLARYDAGGQLVWEKQYAEGAAPAVLHAAVVLPDGDLVAVGSAAVPGQAGVLGAWYLRVKLDDGAVLISKLIPVGGLSAQFRAVVALDGGSVAVAGSAYDGTAPGNGQDGWLAALDPDGNFIWATFAGEAGADTLHALARLPGGEIVAVGADDAGGGALAALFVRISEIDGSVLASTSFAEPGAQAVAWAVGLADSGTIVVGGATDAGQTGKSPVAWQALILHLDGDGKVAQSTVYPAATPAAPGFAGLKTSQIFDLWLRPDGSLAAAGTTGSAAEKTAGLDAAVWTFDAAGQQTALFSHGKAGKDAARSLVSWGGGWLAYGTLGEGDATADALWLHVLPPAPDCDDFNPCTTDTCAPDKGCGHAPVADATPCGAGLACSAGVCQ